MFHQRHLLGFWGMCRENRRPEGFLTVSQPQFMASRGPLEEEAWVILVFIPHSCSHSRGHELASPLTFVLSQRLALPISSQGYCHPPLPPWAFVYSPEPGGLDSPASQHSSRGNE